MIVGQVFEIPFSALIAALILKKGIVSYSEVMELYNRINRLGKDYYVIDDDDSPNFISILEYIDYNNNTFKLKKGFELDTKINKTSVRKILENCAGVELLNFIGYEIQVEKKSSGFARLRNKFIENKTRLV